MRMRRIEWIRWIVTRMVVARLNTIYLRVEVTTTHARAPPSKRMREVAHLINQPRGCDGLLLDATSKTGNFDC